jgi:hypothetical protein
MSEAISGVFSFPVIPACRCAYAGYCYGNAMPARRISFPGCAQRVEWVERSDTHQLQLAKMMGFAKGSTHPTGQRSSAPDDAEPVIGLAFVRPVGIAGSTLHRVRDTRGIGSRRGDLPVGHFCVQPHLQKYFASPVGQIISTNSRHPTPQEGRIMIVTDAGWDAVDAAAFCARKVAGQASRLVSDHKASGRETLLRTAKSCGPDAPTLASSSRRLSRPYRA